ADVDHVRPDGAAIDGKLKLLIVDRERRRRFFGDLAFHERPSSKLIRKARDAFFAAEQFQHLTQVRRRRSARKRGAKTGSNLAQSNALIGSESLKHGAKSLMAPLRFGYETIAQPSQSGSHIVLELSLGNVVHDQWPGGDQEPGLLRQFFDRLGPFFEHRNGR